VTIVRRPPVRAVGHQRGEVFLDRRKIELLELFSIVERLTERIEGRRVLMEDLQVQLIWPPVFVRLTSERYVRHHSVHRALGYLIHRVLTYRLRVTFSGPC